MCRQYIFNKISDREKETINIEIYLIDIDLEMTYYNRRLYQVLDTSNINGKYALAIKIYINIYCRQHDKC